MGLSHQAKTLQDIELIFLVQQPHTLNLIISQLHIVSTH